MLACLVASRVRSSGLIADQFFPIFYFIFVVAGRSGFARSLSVDRRATLVSVSFNVVVVVALVVVVVVVVGVVVLSLSSSLSLSLSLSSG